MKTIGLIHDPEMDESTKRLIAEKRAAYEAGAAKKNSEVSQVAPVGGAVSAEAAAAAESSNGFPPGATLCAKCNTQALVLMDGCQTCLNCGYSKCG